MLQRPTDEYGIAGNGSVHGLFAGHDLVSAATSSLTCEFSSMKEAPTSCMNEVYQ